MRENKNYLFSCFRLPWYSNLYSRITKEPAMAGSFPEVEVVFANNADHLVHDSELIITATGSMNPVFSNQPKLVRNKTFIGIGSFKPVMREFPDCIFERGSRVFSIPH